MSKANSKMKNRIIEIFEDEQLVEKIRRKLPYLFQVAELESSRAGKIGMEVGTLRERIIIALLIHKFGEDNVNTDIPITKAEVDVELSGTPISIKTFTGKYFGGIKLIWTVDAKKAMEFRKNYFPNCGMILVRINWNGIGDFIFIPLEIQKKIFDEMGRRKYIKLPKVGTNPRGVEITKKVMNALVADNATRKIEINWKKTRIDYKPYGRWVDLWREA
jgi:hypothetical protein